jgi:hypothetical protein
LTLDAPNNLIQVASTLAADGRKDRAAVAEFVIDLLDIDKLGYVLPTTLVHLVRIASRWYLTTTYDQLPARSRPRLLRLTITVQMGKNGGHEGPSAFTCSVRVALSWFSASIAVG